MAAQIFDTAVQYIKHQVRREVAKYAWNDTLLQNMLDIPKTIVPGKTPTMRCCVYKERAILAERVKIAMGGDKSNPNVIEVIDIACDGCPAAGHEITDSCRGCLAHRCMDVCPRGAIFLDHNHIAHIDKSKCVECGQCAKVCPYTAIIDRKRPCQSACKLDAISFDEDKAAVIDNDKCIACGACINQCPFGAMMDKSFMLEVIDMLKMRFRYNDFRLYAIVAPSVAGQLVNITLGQFVTGLKQLGFTDVVEAALGADMVAHEESKELAEKGFLTSSCCPAFVDYVKAEFPELAEHISHNLSPMATIAKYIKEHDRFAVTVFIGPCTAKKLEIQKEEVKHYVDSILTFEELHSLFDSRNIDLSTLEETPLDDASYFGRIFARSGGLTAAVEQGLKEHGLDFELKAETCDGIEACRAALMKKSKGVLDANFIEGMACLGGCIGGAGCLTHAPKNRVQIDNYGKAAGERSITDAISAVKE